MVRYYAFTDAAESARQRERYRAHFPNGYPKLDLHPSDFSQGEEAESDSDRNSPSCEQPNSSDTSSTTAVSAAERNGHPDALATPDRTEPIKDRVATESTDRPVEPPRAIPFGTYPPLFDFERDPVPEPEPEPELSDYFVEHARKALSLVPADRIDTAIRPIVRELICTRLDDAGWAGNIAHRDWLRRLPEPDRDRALDALVDGAIVRLSAPDCRWPLFLLAELRETDHVRIWRDRMPLRNCEYDGCLWDPSADGDTGRPDSDPFAMIQWPWAASAEVLKRLATEALAQGGSGGSPSALSPPCPQGRANPKLDEKVRPYWTKGTPPSVAADELGVKPSDVRAAYGRLRKQANRLRKKANRKQGG